MLDRSGLRRAPNAPRLMQPRAVGGRRLGPRKTAWWQFVVPAVVALGLMMAWVLTTRHAATEAPLARADNRASPRAAAGPSVDAKSQPPTPPEARPAPAASAPPPAPAAPAPPAAPAAAAATPPVAIARAPQAGEAPLPPAQQPRSGAEMAAITAPTAPSASPLGLPVAPPPQQPPPVAGPAGPALQENAQAFARLDTPEPPAARQAGQEPSPERPAPAERAPPPEAAKAEPALVASRDAASDKAAKTSPSDKPANVKVPANASLDCLPGELRKVVADVATRFGPVTVLSTHSLNTVNHAKGSVRHKLHTACRAVDFRVEGSVAKVTAYLHSRSELAGVESYRDGVIHIDASERIKGAAVRPRPEPATAPAN